jgi:hypothetical protein
VALYAASDDGRGVLTESMQHRREPPVLMPWAGRFLFGSDREDQVCRGIRTTLDAIKATAESPR